MYVSIPSYVKMLFKYIGIPLAIQDLTEMNRWERLIQVASISREKAQARPFPLYVSIISNRTSNSCPQTVQRMQSDSTVNSSDLTPMPPQSEQRAR